MLFNGQKVIWVIEYGYVHDVGVGSAVGKGGGWSAPRVLNTLLVIHPTMQPSIHPSVYIQYIQFDRSIIIHLHTLCIMDLGTGRGDNQRKMPG